MLVIMRNRTKKKFIAGFRILVTVFILALVFSHLYNMYHGTNVIREGWLREDRPSGHPIRVENTEKAVEKSNPNVLDQFVVKIRDLYQKDQ